MLILALNNEKLRSFFLSC